MAANPISLARRLIFSSASRFICSYRPKNPLSREDVERHFKGELPNN
jgi:hypothetical protein